MCLIYPEALCPSGSIVVAILFRREGRPIVLSKEGVDVSNLIKISALKNSLYYEVVISLKSYEEYIVEDFIDEESTLVLIFDTNVLSRR